MKYLALGDSYTIGECVAEKERWPNQLANKLTKRAAEIGKPTIIATTGWRTDNLANAINIAKLKEEFDLVSLLIGVNNQYQGKPHDRYVSDFEKLLDTSIRLGKGLKNNVFVVSIPDYGCTPFGMKNRAKISKEIDLYNESAREICGQRQIRYVNITDISREALNDPELIASDGLHPSGKMYAMWADRIAAELSQP